MVSLLLLEQAVRAEPARATAQSRYINLRCFFMGMVGGYG
jgi:hypothetical protein